MTVGLPNVVDNLSEKILASSTGVDWLRFKSMTMGEIIISSVACWLSRFCIRAAFPGDAGRFGIATFEASR